MSVENFTIAVAVNNAEVLRSNLYSSPEIQHGCGHQVVIKENYPSASLAYNAAMDDAVNDLMIFVHQDVYLPNTWFADLRRSLTWLEEKRIEWGVLGCFGSRNGAAGGLGRVYTTGLGQHGQPLGQPEPVETLDEIILIVRKSSGLRFDPELPHFHMYGADICLAARDKGLRSYAIPAFCIHNTNQLLRLPSQFYDCYRHIKKKWDKFLPIYTSCMTISRFDRELHLRWLREFGQQALGIERKPKLRIDDPRTLLDSKGACPAGMP